MRGKAKEFAAHVGVAVVFLALVFLLCPVTAEASAMEPRIGLHGSENFCDSEPGELIPLSQLPSGRLAEKRKLVNMEESGVTAPKVLPTVVIVAGFNNMPYQDSFDWHEHIFGASRSVSAYYLDQSYNQFTFAPAQENSEYGVKGNSNTKDTANDGVVHVQLDIDHEDWGAGRGRNVVSRDNMLMKAMNAAGDQGYIDYGAYDTDRNGKIDAKELAVTIIVAGYANEVAPHYRAADFYYHACSGIPDKATEPNTYQIQRCATMAECREPNKNTVVENQYSTMCHELGHTLGLRDMYDTSGQGPWRNYHSSYLSLMAMGNHSVDKDGNPCPTSLDPWAKIKLGWNTPTPATDPGTYRVDAVDYANLSAKETFYKIPIDEKEYYLVENRRFQKWDEGLPSRGYSAGDGLVFWHIDDHYDGQNANASNHRPGNSPLYPERDKNNEYTLIGTKPIMLMPCFSLNFWNQYFLPNHGQIMRLPFFADKSASAAPESRQYSNVKIEILSESGMEMSFRIAGPSEHAHLPETTKENEIAATCETAGSYDVVSRCVECEEEISRSTKSTEALGHDRYNVPRKNETCEEDGCRKHYECRRCDKWFDRQDMFKEVTPESQIRPALGHEWDGGEVTKEATCIEAGSKRFTCTRDDQHTKTETIEKLPHTAAAAVEENRVDPTCEETGSYDEVVRCENCHSELSREQKILPLARHEVVHVSEVPAGCTEAGREGHYQCKNCSRLFRDKDAVQETTYEQLNIEAKDHAWGKWESFDADCHKRVCAHDALHTESEKHEWEKYDSHNETVNNYRCKTCGEEKEIKKHKLSFNVAGGSPSDIPALWLEIEETIKGSGFPANPTKEGSKFLGWEITTAPAPLVTGSMLGDTDKMPAGSVELTAKWTEKSYTVNYEMNGAADIASKTVKYTDGSLVPATTPAWEGRSFEGWYIDESFKTKYENQTYKQIAKADSVEEITLYAKWSTNSYTVKFNTAGADSSTPDPINVTYGTTIVSHPDFPDDPVRPGYSFDGWYTKDITGSEAKLKNSDLMPAKAVTLTAKWTEKSYTVKYNTDGGSQVDDMTGVKWSQTGLIPSTAPKKTGRTFDGWYTASGAKYENQPYSAIATNDNEMSITLTAHWSDTQYTVKYDTDGGTKIDDRSVNWDDGNLAPVNTPKKDGYTFEGWFTNAQKTTAYNNQHYSQLAANDSQESITLYVKWEPTADMRAAMAVKDLIDALPPEDQITPEDGEQIRGAETAYKALTGEQQRLLDVLDSTSKPTLDNALAKLKEVEDQAAADAVTDKINALPAKEEVKLEDEAAITDARKAYEALTEDQKKLITEETLAKLTAAEEGLAAAKDAAALAKAKNDAKAELDKVDVNLYEEPELSVVKKAIDDGKKEIDASTTIPQVDDAKKKALDIIAGQKTAAQKQAERDAEDKEKAEDPKNIPASVTPTTPANLVAVTTAITTAKNDGDLKGSTYAPLKFMSKKQTKKSIKLQWSKVKGAKQYTVYANQCGTKNKYKKLATVKGKTLNVKKVAGKKLKKGTNYKFLIIAENGDKVSAISKTLHIRTAGHKKYANYKSVSVKKTVIKKAKKLKKGKTLKLNAKGVVPKGKKVSVHVKTRYESSNKKVATVTKAGKVKGIKKGKAKIYCYAQNGVSKNITIKVK